MNAYDLITEFRDAVGEDVSVSEEATHRGRFRYRAILRWLTRAMWDVQRVVTAIDDSYYLAEATLAGSGGQDEFDLPSDCLLGRVRFVERKDGEKRVAYWPSDPFEASRHSTAPSVSWWSAGYFEIRGDKLVIHPVPEGAGELVVHYNRRLAELDFGAVPANAGSQDLTLADTARPVDSYYKGYRVTIVGSGTAAGQTRRILAYSASRVCTVEAWSSPPTTSDYYAIECELGEEFERLMVVKAVMMAMERDGRPELALFQQEHDRILAALKTELAGRVQQPGYVHS